MIRINNELLVVTLRSRIFDHLPRGLRRAHSLCKSPCNITYIPNKKVRLRSKVSSSKFYGNREARRCHRREGLQN